MRQPPFGWRVPAWGARNERIIAAVELVVSRIKIPVNLGIDGILMRKNLVVVRAGDRSLHPQWLAEDRSWDLAVSYYGDYPQRYKDQYDFIHLFKGSKWQGLSNFIAENEELISRYEYVWFPDDDLLCSATVIDRFFGLCAFLNFTIAQPALTEYSYYSWPITRRVPDVTARITDFVEIMAPCFRVSSFDKFKHTFAENSSGHGYEWVWKKIAVENGIFKFGIVDATPVFHTRKVGSMGHGGSVDSPQSEMGSLLQKHRISVTQPVTIRKIVVK